MPDLLIKMLKWFIALLIPLSIMAAAVNLLTSDGFVRLEYARPGFPADTYGFTSDQRFRLASENIHYVRGHLRADALAREVINGRKAYDPREVSHMQDVRAVFLRVFATWHAGLFVLVLLALILWLNGETGALARAIAAGGWLTAGLVAGIGLTAILAWQVWFELFHRLFFVPGSWLFSYTDTLIRLFPVQFWSDATLAISGLSLAGGLLAAFAGRQWKSRLGSAFQTQVS